MPSAGPLQARLGNAPRKAANGHQITLDELTQKSSKPLLAVAAIAKPEDFFTMLRAHGLQLASTVALPDHYSFDSWSRNEYVRYTVICTEKDAVKLWHQQPDALAVPLVFTPEPAFMAALDQRLSALLQSH